MAQPIPVPAAPKAPDPQKQFVFTGRQKAAILCMVLGTETTQKIAQKLSGDEMEMLAAEIAQIETIQTPVANAILNEWIESTQGMQAIASGGIEYAREMLESAFGTQKAGQILKRITNTISDQAGLTRLRQTDPQQLAAALRNEHPQTVAVILANLDATQTAGVLKELGTELGGDVLYRMATLDKVSPDTLKMIEASLRAESDLEMARGLRAAGGPEAVAAILNMIQGSQEKEIIDLLAAKDAPLCEQIKNLMFVFEDVANLDDRSLGRVIKDIDMKTLALALKAADDNIKTRLTSVLSQRAKEALKDEMDLMGPVRMRDCQAAQAQIVDNVRKLEESGEIVIAKAGNDDDEVIL